MPSCLWRGSGGDREPRNGRRARLYLRLRRHRLNDSCIRMDIKSARAILTFWGDKFTSRDSLSPGHNFWREMRAETELKSSDWFSNLLHFFESRAPLLQFYCESIPLGFNSVQIHTPFNGVFLFYFFNMISSCNKWFTPNWRWCATMTPNVALATPPPLPTMLLLTLLKQTAILFVCCRSVACTDRRLCRICKTHSSRSTRNQHNSITFVLP